MQIIHVYNQQIFTSFSSSYSSLFLIISILLIVRSFSPSSYSSSSSHWCLMSPNVNVSISSFEIQCFFGLHSIIQFQTISFILSCWHVLVLHLCFPHVKYNNFLCFLFNINNNNVFRPHQTYSYASCFSDPSTFFFFHTFIYFICLYLYITNMVFLYVTFLQHILYPILVYFISIFFVLS